MARFRDNKTLQKFAAAHASIHNHFDLERHLTRRETFKQNRAAVLAERRQLSPETWYHPAYTETSLHWSDSTNNTNQSQLDASAYQGNSGGPILNASGDIIGILSAGIPGKSGFSFAVKAATLSRFLVSHSIKYHAAVSEQKMDAADIYEQAKHYTLFIRCFLLRCILSR
mgnify:CR=1 FL=1